MAGRRGKGRYGDHDDVKRNERAKKAAAYPRSFNATVNLSEAEEDMMLVITKAASEFGNYAPRDMRPPLDRTINIPVRGQNMSDADDLLRLVTTLDRLQQRPGLEGLTYEVHRFGQVAPGTGYVSPPQDLSEPLAALRERGVMVHEHPDEAATSYSRTRTVIIAIRPQGIDQLIQQASEQDESVLSRFRHALRELRDKHIGEPVDKFSVNQYSASTFSDIIDVHASAHRLAEQPSTGTDAPQQQPPRPIP